MMDHFLDDAVEVDVDAICDGEMVLIGGIMEHIEQAGVHSGDSACSLPAYTLSQEIQDVMRQRRRLPNCGAVMKCAAEQSTGRVKHALVTVRVPVLISATLAKVAARVMAGKSLAEQGVTKEVIPPYYSVKEVVLPFNKFDRCWESKTGVGVTPALGSVCQSAAGQQLHHEETRSCVAFRARRR